MTANEYLVGFVLCFWGLLAAVVKVSNWLNGKQWSDGPSLVPVIPIVPLAAVVVGFVINYAAALWGTWTVVGIHGAWLLSAVIGVWPYRTSDRSTSSSEQAR